MLLFELYQEEDDSSVTHNGQRYNLNKLLSITENFKTRPFKVDELKWILKYDKPDPKRMEEADTSVPIIVTYSNKKLVVIDGLHRLCKAIEKGLTHIEGKFVYKDVLEKCKETN
jgi:hypothetical protein